jgi:hypothetical protein
VIGNTRAMTSIPPPTRYHRRLGWHAPSLRRTVIVVSIWADGRCCGVVVRAVGMAVVAG